MSENEEKDTRSISYTEHLRQMKKLRDLYERKLQALRGYYESELAIRSIALPYPDSSYEILDMDKPSPSYGVDTVVGRNAGSNVGRSAGDGVIQEEAAPDMEEISDVVPEGSHYGDDGRQTDVYASGHETLHENMRQTGRMDKRNSGGSYENIRPNVRSGDYEAGYVGADGWTQHHVNPTPSRTDPSVYLRPGMQRTGTDDEESTAGGAVNVVNDHAVDAKDGDLSDAGYTPEQFQKILKIWSHDNDAVSEQEEVAEDAEDAEYGGEGQSKSSSETGSIEHRPGEVPDQETDLPQADTDSGEEMAASAGNGYDGYENQSFERQKDSDAGDPSFQNENQTYANPNTGYQNYGDADDVIPEDDGSAVYPQETDPDAKYGDDSTDARNVNTYPNEHNGYDAASDAGSIPASYSEGVGAPELPYEEPTGQEETDPAEQSALEEAEEQTESEEPSLRALGYDEVYAVEKDDLIFHYQRLELLKSGKQYADAEMFVAPFDLTKDRPDLLVWVLNGEDSRDYCSSHGDPNVHIKIKDCPLQISAQLVPSQMQPGKVHLAVRVTLAPEQKQQGFQIRSTTQIHDGIAALCVETEKSMQIVVHMAPLDFHNDPQTGLVPFAYCIEKPGRRTCGDSINGPVYCDADGYTFEVLCKWDGADENTVYGVLECKE